MTLSKELVDYLNHCKRIVNPSRNKKVFVGLTKKEIDFIIKSITKEGKESGL